MEAFLGWITILAAVLSVGILAGGLVATVVLWRTFRGRGGE
jgi:hypothetical protein